MVFWERKVFDNRILKIKFSDSKYGCINKISKFYNSIFEKIGFTEKEKNFFILSWIILPIFIFILNVGINYKKIINGISFLIFALIFQKLNIDILIKKRTYELNKNIYKVYKFLFNQVSAGVRSTDSITNLYKVVEDQFLRTRLKNMASIYYQTLDIDLALLEVKRFYKSHEIEPFCIVIKQGIDTGENISMLKRQEELMFNKYFNYLELETDRQKIRIIIVVFIFCLIIVLMIGIPLFIEMNFAMEQLFK